MRESGVVVYEADVYYVELSDENHCIGEDGIWSVKHRILSLEIARSQSKVWVLLHKSVYQ